MSTLFSTQHFIWLMMVLFSIGLIVDIIVLIGMSIRASRGVHPTMKRLAWAVFLMFWRTLIVGWLINLIWG